MGKIIKLLDSTVDSLSKSIMITAFFSLFLLSGFVVAVYITTIIEVNEPRLALLSLSFNIILVFITAIYVLFTHGILNQANKSEKRAFIEKRLEKLYYPLQDFMKSPVVFNLCNYDEIQKAMKDEGRGFEIENTEGTHYVRPADSILNICDLQNNNIKKYDFDDVIPYKYLATKELLLLLELFATDFCNVNPNKIASPSPEFKSQINQIKEIIDIDIDSLIEEHTKLL